MQSKPSSTKHAACKKTNEPKTILFALTGHGFFDMSAYDEYFNGRLQPYEYPTEKVAESMDETAQALPMAKRS